MYGPEALVVGVVGHCPPKLLLRVQQLARTSRSGINQRQHLNVQHHHDHQVFNSHSNLVIDLMHHQLWESALFHRQLKLSLRFWLFKPETTDETESHQTSDHSSFSVFSWSWVFQKIKHFINAIICGLQTFNGQVFHTFVLIVFHLQTYLKLSKSSLFVLSMNLERRTSPILYCVWTSLLIVLKRNVFFKPTSKVEQRD